MPDEVFQAMRAAEKAKEADDADVSFFQLIYNEQFARGRRLVRRSWLGRRGHATAGVPRPCESATARSRIGSWPHGQIKHAGQRGKAVACNGCRQNMNGRRNLVIRRRYSG